MIVTMTITVGGMVAMLSAAADAHTVKAMSERRRQRRATTGSCHQAVARDRVQMTKMSSRRSSSRRTMTIMTTGIGPC
jgi:hypothetical protein